MFLGSQVRSGKLKRSSLTLLVVLGMGHIGFGQQASVEDQLAVSRQQIDKIDSQIVDLINRRAAIVDKIGAVKSAARLPTTVPHREQEVLTRVAHLGASGPFPISRLQSIYSTLLTQMREWEEERRHLK